MTTYDLSPLLRSSVGFDVFDNIFDSVFNLNESNTSYPPYNILKSDNNYSISLAIAGFSKDEVDISIQENELVIKGVAKDQDNKIEFLHRGIAGRNFERKFRLADTIKVSDASYENGLLSIYLEREIPDHQKPRKIDINNKSFKKIN
ncbi:uncharacterized protein METZ01_LOCUS105655 [marine metagenome]|uniref:SHSP domain-containing protein n=1 Tax=marine metagenome TaxID=408172 RepID=A0A381WKH9_9ZZZZ